MVLATWHPLTYIYEPALLPTKEDTTRIALRDGGTDLTFFTLKKNGGLV